MVNFSNFDIRFQSILLDTFIINGQNNYSKTPTNTYSTRICHKTSTLHYEENMTKFSVLTKGLTNRSCTNDEFGPNALIGTCK